MGNNIVNCESQLQHLLFYSFFFSIKSVTRLCLIYLFNSSLTKCVTAKLFKRPCKSSRCKHWQPLFTCLEVDWFEFHFSSFNGVVISLPMIPVHTISIWRVSSAMIEAVQVGMMTGVVPPSPLVTCSTVNRIPVIVSIFSGERVASMMS